ncbi:MAG TPA: DUF1559 domain-containing protein, partial [Pirellulaceae bacterium]|nr:DUF1559 domain-containing protein [Pirellulaceae bacterium]
MNRALSNTSCLGKWTASVTAAVACLVATTAAMGQPTTGLKQELQSLAPEKCWFYTAWDHSHENRADSLNHVERMLAEPEIRSFVSDLLNRLADLPRVMEDMPAAKRRALRNVALPVLEALFKRGGCVYLEDLMMPDEGNPPRFQGAVWLDIGASSADVVRDLLTLIDQPADSDRLRKLDNHSFYHIDVDKEFELDFWIGSVDTYLVVAADWNRLEAALIRRQAGTTADWLAALHSRRTLQRTTGIGYLNVARVRSALAPLGGPEVESVLDALGLNQLEAIESQSGLSETEMVTWMSFRLNGKPTGLFDLAGDAGITPKDLSQIPADSLFAFSVSLDTKKILRLVETFAERMEPGSSEQMAEWFEGFQSETGVDLERDILKNFGSTWTVYNGAGDGWLTGLTISGEVANEVRMSAAFERLVQMAQRDMYPGSYGPILLRSMQGGLTVYSLRFPGSPVPVEPSWCVSNGRVVFTLFPSSMRSAVGGVEFERLVTDKAYQQLLSAAPAGSRLIGLSYTDTKRQFEMLYPYAQIMLTMGQSMMSELGGPMSNDFQQVGELLMGIQLPPARVIHRHLQPSWAIMSQHEQGIDFESRHTLPTLDMAVVVPFAVGLTLPAVQQVRAAAQRASSQNNMRLIVIAAHNFHETYRRFPAAYSVDEEGQPLLSWRVHLLPFLDNNRLYEQFRLDEPWDSEHNIRLVEQMPDIYRSPNSFADAGMTVYRGIGGP